MKLYATTTSERGKQALKGGNSFIRTDFTDENRKLQGRVFIEVYKGVPYIEYWHNGTRIAHYPFN